MVPQLQTPNRKVKKSMSLVQRRFNLVPMMKPALPALELLLHSNDEEVVKILAWHCDISNGSEDGIQSLTESDFVQCLQDQFGSLTSSRARIETSIPRKHGPAIAGYESALKKFFENVLQAFLKHVDFSVVRCAVIASPGFTKGSVSSPLIVGSGKKTVVAFISDESFLSNAGSKLQSMRHFCGSSCPECVDISVRSGLANA
ncbi:PREDICTED: uncharacterized protein LOC109126976 [Camelina sativa]|uniref:Uncharacterized protein LOC109126976 n=1 Tax=Camelina sativa TaxID=90675 RepID=A0ABM1QIF4_CAMSA|nr:PREDICTED: uncharacterized protein LOC109126976 [Camelina sativa]